MLRSFYIFSCYIFYIINGYRILVVFPIPSKSHGLLGEAVVKALLNDGHQITYVTSFPMKKLDNLTQIDLSSDILTRKRSLFGKKIRQLINNEVDQSLKSPIDVMVEYNRMTLENKELINLIKYTNKRFDAVIAEWMHSELFSGLGPVFGCPFIWYNTMDPDWMSLQLMEGRTDQTTTGSIFSKEVPPFNFLGRMRELIFRIRIIFSKYFWTSVKDKENYDKVYKEIAKARGTKFTPYEIAKYNASLMLLNSHISYSQPMLLPENCKSIGGHHVAIDHEPLSKKLQAIMDNAKNGFIYFSVGTNLRSSHIPDEIKTNILKVFGNLNQTVILKLDEDLPNKPNNVHVILGWVAQTAVLAHPHCTLFITHGGLLSIIESINFGVPIIGMPVFADQFSNVAEAVQKGYAIKVDWAKNTEDNLLAAIRDILENSEYRNNLKKLTWIYHNRLVLPQEELVHWVKHVIQTNGAPHLRSAALVLSWYQRMYLDWALFLILIIITINKILSALDRLVSKNLSKLKEKEI